MKFDRHKGAGIRFDYSQEEYEGAMLKLKEAASRTSADKTGVSYVLGGFECQALSPPDFRDLMRRHFGMELSPKELGAITRSFDRDGTGMISTTAFLLTFTQLQRFCRADMLSKRSSVESALDENKRRLQDERERRVREEEERSLRHTAAHVSSLMEKLKEAAKIFVLNRYAPLSVCSARAHLTRKRSQRHVEGRSTTLQRAVTYAPQLLFYFQEGLRAGRILPGGEQTE